MGMKAPTHAWCSTHVSHTRLKAEACAINGWMIKMNKDEIKAEILDITGVSFIGFGITGVVVLFTYLLVINISSIPAPDKENMKLAILVIFLISGISGILWIPLMLIKSWQDSWKQVNHIDV